MNIMEYFLKVVAGGIQGPYDFFDYLIITMFGILAVMGISWLIFVIVMTTLDLTGVISTPKPPPGC